MSYLSIIPKDILVQIFIKIVEPYYLSRMLGSVFDVIFSLASAWKLKIMTYFKNITWGIVPKSLLDYQDGEIIKNLFMYDRLYWSHDAAMKHYEKTIKDKESISTNLGAINNFDVLTLKYTNRVPHNVEKNIYTLCQALNEGIIKRWDRQDAFEIHFNIDHFEFELISDNGVGSYPVSHQDIFNAFLHLCYNGAILL